MTSGERGENGVFWEQIEKLGSTKGAWNCPKCLKNLPGPNTIVSDRGSVFISQITKKLNESLGIKLQPSTAYHPWTNGQLEIANKEVEQYLRHYVCYHQDNWEGLLALAEFAYNNSDHTSMGMLPFRANYGYDLNLGGIQSAEQCFPDVEDLLRQMARVQEDLKACLEAEQEAMSTQFNKKVRSTPTWRVGDEVWLNSRQISTTRPCPKLGHQWLGPFSICAQVSTSAYKLTLPASMRGVHPVFHVSVLRQHNVDTINQRKQPPLTPIAIVGREEWEVEEILDCRKRGKKIQYLVSWKGYGPEENSWEKEDNLDNCRKAVADFNS
jgi:hypothetical protein